MATIFETHATSVDNEKCIASGHNDSQLSATGIMQARQLGMRYEKKSIDVVYCSDLARSYDTATIAFEKTGTPIISDSRLREWDYGIFNGAPATEVEKLKSDYLHTPFPEGESLDDAVDRILRCIDDIDATRKILLIGHRAVFYALECRYNKRSFQELITRPWKWQAGWKYNR
ncbi:MAG: histidine phosphatase family protein [Waddliaceae bacterium]|jgi:2,3-bisphosphoglycerate-dependent phosphoglycerate mutase|nr:histidine phosphatase family protein [Waddliaceae bacterium]MBT4445066.1 histidine phosphatase family protein [Waddliaceae bacterium]MBT7264367.1 histidine phosphatase family protein [Waddliaceae bacterium]